MQGIPQPSQLWLAIPVGLLGSRNPHESVQQLLPLAQLHRPDGHARYLYLTCQCWPVALT